MRYLWDLYPAYRNEWTRSRWKRAAMTPLANYLRLWDYASAARVDQFVANSRNVQQRIWKTYRREVDVIHPPVDVESFYWKPAEDYFLIVSELVPYKRIDSVVRLVLAAPAAGCRSRATVRSTAGCAPWRGPECRVSRPRQRCRTCASCTRAAAPSCCPAKRISESPGGSPGQRQARGRAGPRRRAGDGAGLRRRFLRRAGGASARPSNASKTMEFRPAELQSWARQFSEEEFARKMAEVLATPASRRRSPVTSRRRTRQAAEARAQNESAVSTHGPTARHNYCPDGPDSRHRGRPAKYCTPRHG